MIRRRDLFPQGQIVVGVCTDPASSDDVPQHVDVPVNHGPQPVSRQQAREYPNDQTGMGIPVVTERTMIMTSRCQR
jgi:hypothetical protein